MKEYQYILTFYPYDGSASSTLTLDVNPDNWDKLKTTFGRHDKYRTVQRSYTDSLKFLNLPNGGYSFIVDAMEIDGIFANITVEIKKRNPSTNGYTSKYTKKIDLTPGNYSKTDEYFEAKLIDLSKLQKLNNRDENEINIFSGKSIEDKTITVPTKHPIYLTPVDITVKIKGTSEISEDADYDGGEDFIWYNYYKNPVYEINESSNFNIDNSEIIYKNNYLSISYLNLKFHGNYHFYGGARNILLGAIGTYVKLYNENDILQSTDTLYYQFFAAGGEFENFDFEGVYDYENYFTLNPGWYITVEQIISVRNPLYKTIRIVWHTRDENLFDATEKIEGLDTTQSNVLKIHEVLDTLLRQIVDEDSAQFKSNLLGDTDLGYESDGEASSIMAMNGFIIRNYPTPTFNLVFDKLFNSVNAIRNVGLWYNEALEKFELEDIDYFYQDVEITDLGEVDEINEGAFVKGYFNKITSGFDNDGNYERVSGAHEFAVKREYSTSAPCKDAIDIQSPYRMDSVGIEDIRNKQYSSTGSTDNNSDNDVFLVDSDYLEILTETNLYPKLAKIADFPADSLGYEIFKTYYNLFYTPRQNAIRWGNILGTTHYKKEALPIKAQKTTKLFELELGSTKVDENSDISLTEFEQALFTPKINQIKCIITDDQELLINANPHGYLTYSVNGVKKQGFINKGEIEDYSRIATFDLILKDAETEYRVTSEGDIRITSEDENRVLS